MSPQTTSNEQSKIGSPRRLWQPEETFWEHYSPHHEFPLATVGAITLCGMALGTLVLWWILVGFDLNAETDRPPSIDAVVIGQPEGGGGGYDRQGAGNSPRTAKEKTELVKEDITQRHLPQAHPDTTIQRPNEIKLDPLTPLAPLDPTAPKDDQKSFEKLEKDANQTQMQQKMDAERQAAQKALRQAAKDGTGGPPGGRNSPGSGGGTGGGVGIGIGTKIGPGTGGNPFGRPATRHEIHAYRWKLYLPPDINQHVQTLIAWRVTYVFEAGGKQYKVRDLRRTPVELVAIPQIDPKEVVAWKQIGPMLMRGLAQRLKLTFVPSAGIITLPDDVEEKLATLEHEALEKQGRREETVRFTNFNVRFAKDVYEPYVTGFE